MNNKDYPEIILQAIDQVVTKRLEGISYDVTDTVTIINADEAKNGKYKVSNGSATYYAYSSDTTYEEDDVVYMTVPNGDYTQQKIIIGKYVAENDKPYVYESPFQTIVDVSGNVIQDVVKTQGLIANDPEDVEIVLWDKSFADSSDDIMSKTYTGYTRLGIQAQFRTWLKELDCMNGVYGLELILEAGQEATSESVAIANAALEKAAGLDGIIFADGDLTEDCETVTYLTKTLKMDLSDLRTTVSEPYVKALEELEKNTELSDAEKVTARKNLQTEYKTKQYSWFFDYKYWTDRSIYSLDFSCNDMYGDPYNYSSFYQQEKVFDISNIGTIARMYLRFYQDPGSFHDREGELIPYLDDIGTRVMPNIFVKDPYICLGYDKDSFNDESITLFTTNTPTYTSKNTDEENKKIVSLRWFHDGEVYNKHSDELGDYTINWYQYALGAPAADEYSGVYWKKIDAAYVSEVYIPELVSINRFQLFFDDSRDDKYTKNFNLATANSRYYAVKYFDENFLKKYNVSLEIQEKGFYNYSYAQTAGSITATKGEEQSWVNMYESSWVFHDKVYGNRDYYSEETIYNAGHVGERYKVSGCIHYLGFWERFCLAYRLYWMAPDKFDALGASSIWRTGGEYGDEIWKNTYQGKNPTSFGYNLVSPNTNFKTMLNSFTNSFGGWAMTDEDEWGITDYRPTNEETYQKLYALGKQIFELLDYPYQKVENLHPYDYILVPDTSKAEEKIKVILINGSDILYSNIITFTNEQEVVNQATKDFVAGLNIWCNDGTYGNYYIYDPGDKILEQYRTNEAHSVTAMFSAEDTILNQENSAALLSEAESITWTFNAKESMIKVNNINYSYKTTSGTTIAGPSNGTLTSMTDNIYHFTTTDNEEIIYDPTEETISITRKGDVNNGYAIDPKQYYFIEETYSQAKQNNVIQCRIVKDGKEYFTSKRLNFGQAGTTGTDATLRLYFDPASQQALYSQDGGSTLKVRAVLYDSQNQEVDLNDETDFHGKITWSWYVSDVVSWKEQEVTTTTGEKKTETVQVITEKLDAVTIKPYSYTNTSSSTDYNLRIKKSVISSDAKEEDKYNYYKSNNRNIVILNTDKKLDMNTFLILEATLKGWGNYDLTVRKPIPIQVPGIKKTDSEGNEETYKLSYVDCADEIIYSTAGYPSYYKEAWKLHLKDDENNNMSMDEVASTIWSTFHTDEYSGTFSDKYILQPLGVYVKNALQYGAQVKLSDGTVLWTQPIYQCSNNYPSSTLNQWDGKSLTMNEENGSILATAISAGKKNSDDNTFSGVMLGDWKTIGGTSTDISTQTGVYGFDHGLMSYAFKEDGTAFIGKSGMGRIMFDGTSSTIQSEQYRLGKGGMLINLKDGIIKMSEDGSEKSNRVTIDVTAPTYPLMIGTGEQEKFKVKWDGSMEATNGEFSGIITGSSIYIPNKSNYKFKVDENGILEAVDGTFSGKITSTEGEIGGFIIGENALYSKNNGGKWGAEGVYLGSGSTAGTDTTSSPATFSLGNKFKYDGKKLFIASNIYREDADGENAAYFLIGINSVNKTNQRLQIGSASSDADYDGMSLYGAGKGIYLVAVGTTVTAASPNKVLQLRSDGVTLYGYTAKQQEGIYARFA